MIDKTDQLFIRACKSWNSDERLLRVYRRFYYSHGSDEEAYREIAGILGRISEEHFAMPVEEMVRYIDPNAVKWIFDKEEHSFSYRVMNAYRLHLYKMDGKVLIELGYVNPAFFRNKK